MILTIEINKTDIERALREYTIDLTVAQAVGGALAVLYAMQDKAIDEGRQADLEHVNTFIAEIRLMDET